MTSLFEPKQGPESDLYPRLSLPHCRALLRNYQKESLKSVHIIKTLLLSLNGSQHHISSKMLEVPSISHHDHITADLIQLILISVFVLQWAKTNTTSQTISIERKCRTKKWHQTKGLKRATVVVLVNLPAIRDGLRGWKHTHMTGDAVSMIMSGCLGFSLLRSRFHVHTQDLSVLQSPLSTLTWKEGLVQY